MGVGIPEPDISGSVKLYPNPGNGWFHLEVAKVTGNHLEYRVYNVHGQTLLHFPEQRVSEEIQRFDLRPAPSGIYFIHIRTDAGSAVVKFVKS